MPPLPTRYQNARLMYVPTNCEAGTRTVHGTDQSEGTMPECSGSQRQCWRKCTQRPAPKPLNNWFEGVKHSNLPQTSRSATHLHTLTQSSSHRLPGRIASTTKAVNDRTPIWTSDPLRHVPAI
jgi:hypothetical protein